MTVLRIVPNLGASNPARARAFYGTMLGLDVVMDMGCDPNQASSRYWLDPSSSCHKWRPYLVSRACRVAMVQLRNSTGFQRFANDASRVKEQTHVTMVFAAAHCHLRANLEL